MKTRLALLAFTLASVWAMATQAQSNDADVVARGKYVAITGDCMPCHTVPGQAPFSGGRVIETPFGLVASANITPDKDTGIGAWSEADFASALRHGKSPNGHLYPAMPYPSFTRMTDEDVQALFTYLSSLPPVHNTPDRNQLPFPLNQRFLLTGWNLLFFKEGRSANEAGKSAEWNRGAYLVNGPGHCGACHTPKNFLGGDEHSKTLEGGTLQYWHANDLTNNDVSGLGKWTLDDVVDYLKSGHNRYGAAAASMAEVVVNSTSKMTDADVHAMAVYLKDLPARDLKAPAKVAETDAAMKTGLALYVDNCSACHGPAGDGASHLFPMLKDNASVRDPDPTTLIRVVLEGTQTAATDANPSATAMPAFGWKLNDAEIAAVLTYVRNSWENAAPAVSANDVGAIRKKLPRPQ